MHKSATTPRATGPANVLFGLMRFRHDAAFHLASSVRIPGAGELLHLEETSATYTKALLLSGLRRT